MGEAGSKVETRHIAAAMLGNALEFYDFTVFAFFAIQIGAAFFPSSDPFASMIAALATFGAGFVSRPLGALVLGRYADRAGRIPAMMLSMGLMGLAIVMLVICPGYAAIGPAAPLVAVVARLVQGFALGGEVGPSTAYILEAASLHRRGLIVASQRATQLAANALAAGVGLLLSLTLSTAGFHDYGWRIALALGTLLVPYALWARRAMPELAAEHRTNAHDEALVSDGYRRAVICGFLIITGGTIGAYIGIYMTTFAQATLRLTPTAAMAGQLVNNLIGVAACFVGGWLADRIGRRPVLMAGFGGVAVLGPPLFALLLAYPTPANFALVTTALAILGGLGVTAAMVAIAESLPHQVRSSVFALVYTLPVSIFGGTTQVIVAWLTKATGSSMTVAWYSSAAMTIAVVAMLAMRESAPVRRRVLAQA